MDGAGNKQNNPETEELKLQIDKYDIEEIQEILGGAPGMDVVTEKPPEAHGEPVTVAIILVTPIVVQAIALWALKNRRKKTIEVHAEKTHPDGSREVLLVKLRVSESTSTRDAVEQVVNGMHLDPALVEATLALGA